MSEHVAPVLPWRQTPSHSVNSSAKKSARLSRTVVTGRPTTSTSTALTGPSHGRCECLADLVMSAIHDEKFAPCQYRGGGVDLHAPHREFSAGVHGRYHLNKNSTLPVPLEWDHWTETKEEPLSRRWYPQWEIKWCLGAHVGLFTFGECEAAKWCM